MHFDVVVSLHIPAHPKILFAREQRTGLYLRPAWIQLRTDKMEKETSQQVPPRILIINFGHRFQSGMIFPSPKLAS